MPKDIDVTLQSIFCDSNGFGSFIKLTGDVFGATFQNNPDDPNDQKVHRDIFPFPSGPISISEGETVAVTMQAVRFSLSAPSIEPPELAPKFLKFGGELNNGLGAGFTTIRFDESLPFKAQPGENQVPPRQFAVAFASSNLSITLTFGLLVAEVF